MEAIRCKRCRSSKPVSEFRTGDEQHLCCKKCRDVAATDRAFRREIVPADAIKVSLATNAGPHGLMLLVVVEQAVCDINAFRNRRKANRKLTSDVYNKLLMHAKDADLWLRGKVSSRLTLEDVSLWHGMDLDQMRDRIYEQWSPEFLERLRSLLPASRGRGESKIVELHQEREVVA